MPLFTLQTCYYSVLIVTSLIVYNRLRTKEVFLYFGLQNIQMDDKTMK